MVDLDELIDTHEVAELLGLSHANSVTTYSRRYATFPLPVIEFANGRCRLWLRPEVQLWSDEHQRN